MAKGGLFPKMHHDANKNLAEEGAEYQPPPPTFPPQRRTTERKQSQISDEATGPNGWISGEAMGAVNVIVAGFDENRPRTEVFHKTAPAGEKK